MIILCKLARNNILIYALVKKHFHLDYGAPKDAKQSCQNHNSHPPQKTLLNFLYQYFRHKFVKSS